ncbi:MAG: methyltransferase domain-containing protein [Candidatus Nanoarchaeia archaeon]|nr:methyltransferase domain-containing protein [Candidatus Nanoarchaeia archaeon]
MLNHSHSNKYKFIKSLGKIDYKKMSCLDIGGSQNSVKQIIKNTKILDINNSDIKFDLIKDFTTKKKLPLKSNSFDLVVISQVLEHTINPDEIFKEAKRIAKKYVLLSLPNDLTLDNRIRLLFGLSSGFEEFGHKQVLNYRQINDFLKKNKGKEFRIINEFNLFASKGGRFLPLFFREFLAKSFPSIFCKEKFWLLEKNVD